MPSDRRTYDVMTRGGPVGLQELSPRRTLCTRRAQLRADGAHAIPDHEP
jgi:hypothetical protein